jgi:serine/threonine-protein kinase
MDINRPDVATPLTTDPGAEEQPAPSPDGKWLAFVSNRTGRPEVVLTRLVDDGRSLRVTDQRLPVSSAGGIDPHWRADGRELLYNAPGRTIMAVSVTIAGNGASLGKPVELFRVPADAGGTGANWTVNRDHTRFVVVEAPNEMGQTFKVLTRWR